LGRDQCQSDGSEVGALFRLKQAWAGVRQGATKSAATLTQTAGRDRFALQLMQAQGLLEDWVEPRTKVSTAPGLRL